MDHPTSRNSHLFAILGGILVIIGLLALIIGSWSSFTPTGRILTSVLPLAALYILIMVARTKPEARPVIPYALITASVSLPLVLGVILFQSGLFTEVNAELITLVALVSTLNAGLIEFLYGDRLHTPLTITSLLVAAIGFMSWFALDLGGCCTVLLLVGALMLAMGVLQGMDSRNSGTAAWHSTGAVLVLGSLALLPFSLTQNTIGDDLRSSLTSLTYVGSAAITFCIAALYSRLWQVQKQQRYLYEIRIVFERVAALFLVLPAMLLTFTTSFGGTFLVLLGTSLISLGISTKVRVSWYRVLGLLGLAVALLRLVVLGLRDLAAIWPIVLVGLGILLFIAAIFGAHKASKWNQSLFTLPETTWEHLGEPITPAQTKKTAQPEISGWFWLILAIVILWALSTL
jgi:hypothetical protein